MLSNDYQIQSAPFKDTWRRIDELIPVDDASHQRSVQAMLDRASHSADTTNDGASPPEQDQTSSATPEGPTDTDQSLPLADMDDPEEVETKSSRVDVVPDKLGQSQSTYEDPRMVASDTAETDMILEKVVNNPVTTTFSQADDDEDPDIDNDRGTDRDPNYTAVVQPGDTDRRATRATRNPAIPHCSLLVQVVMQVVAQSASI